MAESKPSGLRQTVHNFLRDTQRGMAAYTINRIMAAPDPILQMAREMGRLQRETGDGALAEAITTLCVSNGCSKEAERCELGDKCPADPIRRLRARRKMDLDFALSVLTEKKDADAKSEDR